MMLSTPPPRTQPRARLLPGLSLRAGDVLGGRFRIESLVDVDRASVQLAGLEVATRTPVAIELLVADGEGADAAGLAFLAGARTAATLASSHLPRILEVGVTSEGHPYVVREPAAPRTLASFLEEHPALATEHAVDIAVDICEALVEAHRSGLVHGAVSTRSIHLSWSEAGPAEVKLVGLGTAAALSLLCTDVSAMTVLVARAPELLKGEDPDMRTDVWGVGVLLYTMLAGASPFAAETPSTLRVAVESEEAASLAGVPDALADLVDACLARERDKRPRDIAALAEVLAPFIDRSVESLARVLCESGIDSSPTVVVERNEYDALAREKSAAPPAVDSTAKHHVLTALAADSSLEIPIEVTQSVRELEPAPASAPDPAAAQAQRPKAGSVPPVALSIPPRHETPTVLVRRRPRRWKMTGLAAVLACLAVGAGVASLRGDLSRRLPIAAQAPAAAPLAPAPAPAPAPLPPQAASPAPPPPAPIEAPTPKAEAPKPEPPKPEPPKAVRLVAAKARAAAPAPSAASAQRPSADATLSAASAPKQPEPKASDDDLRKFLDDRR